MVPHVYSGRNRSFVFANYEEWRYRRYSNPIFRVPTEAERQGDFSALRDVRGVLIPIYDPLTTRANPSGSGFVRDPFQGNRIPAENGPSVAEHSALLSAAQSHTQRSVHQCQQLPEL